MRGNWRSYCRKSKRVRELILGSPVLVKCILISRVKPHLGEFRLTDVPDVYSGELNSLAVLLDAGF